MHEMRLEVVPVPISAVDQDKAFYVEKIGVNSDFDDQQSNTVRVVQVTPPGSGCSILLGTDLGDISAMKPGSLKGLHLVVKEVGELRGTLLGWGVEVSEIVEYPRGIKFAYFSDAVGNTWALQEIPPGI